MWLSNDDLIAGKYYITTQLFEKGGRAIMGPFKSVTDARDMRAVVERHSGVYTHWIDKAPDVLVSATPGHGNRTASQDPDH